MPSSVHKYEQTNIRKLSLTPEISTLLSSDSVNSELVFQSMMSGGSGMGQMGYSVSLSVESVVIESDWPIQSESCLDSSTNEKIKPHKYSYTKRQITYVKSSLCHILNSNFILVLVLKTFHTPTPKNLVLL